MRLQVATDVGGVAGVVVGGCGTFVQGGDAGAQLLEVGDLSVGLGEAVSEELFDVVARSLA